MALEIATLPPRRRTKKAKVSVSNLDEALARFHLSDLEYAGGRASHGPMGAEALASLGHQALIPAFLDLYVPRLPPAAAGRALSGAEQESELGEAERRADWVATFEARLEGGDWRVALSTALPALLPGLFAGAGHGLIRTAHAARLLEREDSPLRRRELARGLAYWAARFDRLPGLPGSLPGQAVGLGSFFEALPKISSSETVGELFFVAAKRLDAVPEFARALERVKRPNAADAEVFLDALCLKAAELYCDHPHARVAYVHALTIPCALRLLLAHLDSDEVPQACLYVLQAVAALHALSDDAPKSEGTTQAEASWGPASSPDEQAAEVRTLAENWDEIRYRAACSIQEHAIKMVEACWRCDQAHPNVLFRRAAADAALRIEGAAGSGGC